MSPAAAPALLLGPLLRHVDPVSATIWVETDGACEVEVLGRRARTFGVAGHHYALVVVEDLAPGSSTPYEVRLDGHLVWPRPRSTFPPSRIRTPGGPASSRRPFRLVFGSCRYATPASIDVRDGIPPDALDAYATRMLALPEAQWPDALVLLGDQIYADEITPVTRSWLATRRDLSRPPGAQAADFEEYTRLYTESWGDAEVRWLLSTLPSAMIFDDHEMIDDWNTSAAWRAEVTGQEWWQRRITGGLASYWVYQHLGNLSPHELTGNATWRAMQGADDAAPVLAEMARRADGDPTAFRWSYLRHWGPARLIMIDSRAGRVLDEQHRQILDDAEFDWVDAEMRRAAEENVQHLIIGTSLPWLLPHAIHQIERWNETLNVRHHTRPLGRLAEKLRQAADLEHWAAFGHSFERLGASLVAVARGEYGPAPATALVLSGDVHHAYVAELVAPADLGTRVHQLTVSPLHNQAPHAIEIGFRVGWSRWARALTSGVARLARVPRTQLDWVRQAGPFFGNELGELTFTGREARFALWATHRNEDGAVRLRQVLDLELS